MKILHVFDFFSPTYGGGVFDGLRRLTVSLAARGHRVDIYTSDFALDRTTVESLTGVTVHPFPSRLKIGGMHVTPALIRAARENLSDFDIIHLHTYRSFQNIVICHYARKSGIPCILEAHGSTPRLAAGRKSPMVFLKWLYDVFFGVRNMKAASRLIAGSRVGIEEYVELGAGEDGITFIHPPLAIEEFEDLPPHGTFRRRFGIGSSRLVMFLGRINWIKGLDFLLESFTTLLRRRRDVLLAIVGPDDGYLKNVETSIARLRIKDKVILTGFLGGVDKLAALADSDVIVQPSIYEQTARLSLEALMCRTPVIVSKNTGAGEIIRNIEGGALVEYGDVGGLVRAINETLDDPAAARLRTEKAREYIRANFSLENRTDRYEEVYREAIALQAKSKPRTV